MIKLFHKTFSIIEITRPVNFLLTFFSILVAGILSAETASLTSKILLAAVAGSLTGSAGNIINDYFDVEIDRINRPKRVLPSGRLSTRTAVWLYIILTALAAAICTFVNFTSLMILLFAVLVIFFYSFKLKSIPLLGNFAVASITGLAFIFGAAAVGNWSGGIIPALFALQINFIREILKDMEDVTGDRRSGVITFPIKYGFDNAEKLIFTLAVALMLTTLIPFIFHIYKIEFFIIVMVTVNPILIYLLKALLSNRSQMSLKKLSSLLKLGMAFGLIAIYMGK